MTDQRKIDFLLVDDFSMVGFLCALSAFRIANEVQGRTFYQTRILAERAAPVSASVGIVVAPEAAMAPSEAPDLVFVCAGVAPSRRYSKALGAWLRRVARRGATMAAISTGADLLARAGLLNGRRCTIYWERAAAFAEEFPDVALTDQIFEIDRDRLTCGGATASIDLRLYIIAEDLGARTAASVSAAFLLERVREAGERQRQAPVVGAAPIPDRLARAIGVMEAHIEAPLSLDAIAADVGLGPRHLRRLFQDALNISPKAYYLRIRLTRARELAVQTRMSLQEIVMACGFGSASGFASAYRRAFGASPRRDRLDRVGSEANAFRSDAS